MEVDTPANLLPESAALVGLMDGPALMSATHLAVGQDLKVLWKDLQTSDASNS